MYEATWVRKKLSFHGISPCRYSRSLPLPHTLRLWDMIIAVDDPAFSFFIGLALLRRRREPLLAAGADDIPEVMQTLSFAGENDVDNVVRL